MFVDAEDFVIIHFSIILWELCIWKKLTLELFISNIQILHRKWVSIYKSVAKETNQIEKSKWPGKTLEGEKEEKSE